MLAFITSIPADPNDQEFILQIYQKYVRLMYRTVYKYISNKADCDDLVQESVLKMVEKVSYIRTLSCCTLPAYVVSIVRNTAINHLKRQAVSQKHLTRLASLQTTESPDLDDLTHLLYCKELLATILDLLPPDERLLLEGKHMLGYTDQELAQQLKCKPDSIRMKMTRARRSALQLLMERKGEIND